MAHMNVRSITNMNSSTTAMLIPPSIFFRLVSPEIRIF